MEGRSSQRVGAAARDPRDRAERSGGMDPERMSARAAAWLGCALGTAVLLAAVAFSTGARHGPRTHQAAGAGRSGTLLADRALHPRASSLTVLSVSTCERGSASTADSRSEVRCDAGHGARLAHESSRRASRRAPVGASSSRVLPIIPAGPQASNSRAAIAAIASAPHRRACTARGTRCSTARAAPAATHRGSSRRPARGHPPHVATGDPR